MAVDDQLAQLLTENAVLYAAYETWANAQALLVQGKANDPDSFNATGGKTGALGYYPVTNASGQTIYVPSIARLQEIALGGANADTLAVVLADAHARLQAIDSSVANANSVVAAAVARAEAAGTDAAGKGAYAKEQGDAAKAQALAIGDISAKVAGAIQAKDAAAVSQAAADASAKAAQSAAADEARAVTNSYAQMLPGDYPDAVRIETAADGTVVQAYGTDGLPMLGAFAAERLAFLPVGDGSTGITYALAQLLPGDLPGAASVSAGSDGVITQAYDNQGQPMLGTAVQERLTNIQTGDGSTGITNAYAQMLPGDYPGAASMLAGSDGVLIQAHDNRGLPLVDTGVAVQDERIGSLLPFDGFTGTVGEDSVPSFGMDTRTGQAVLRMPEPTGMAYLTGASPNREVRMVTVDGVDIRLSMPGSDPSGFVQTYDTVSYIRTVAGYVANPGNATVADTVPRMESVSIARENFAVGALRLIIAPVYGQSNSCGFGNNRFEPGPVTRTPTRPGRVKMPQAGPRIVSSLNGNKLVYADVARWVDAFERHELRENTIQSGLGETPCSGLGWSLTEPGGLPATDVVVTATAGIGGKPISTLKKGQLYYHSLMRWIHQETVRARVNGLTPVVLYLTYIGTESDATNAAFQADLAQFQSDVDTDVKAITGQASTVKLAGSQVSNWTGSTGGTGGFSRAPNNGAAPMAILNLARQFPARFIVNGPLYPFPYGDNIHLNNTGNRSNGELCGRAQVRDMAGLPTALYITAATRTDTTVLLTFGTAEGQLVLDTSLVVDPGNAGVTYRDANDASVAVSAVQVVGTNQLQFTIASPVAGTVGIANEAVANSHSGPLTGARSTIRDTVAAVGASGAPLHHYACFQLQPVA